MPKPYADWGPDAVDQFSVVGVYWQAGRKRWAATDADTGRVAGYCGAIELSNPVFLPGGRGVVRGRVRPRVVTGWRGYRPGWWSVLEGEDISQGGELRVSFDPVSDVTFCLADHKGRSCKGLPVRSANVASMRKDGSIWVLGATAGPRGCQTYNKSRVDSFMRCLYGTGLYADERRHVL